MPIKAVCYIMYNFLYNFVVERIHATYLVAAMKWCKSIQSLFCFDHIEM